MAYWRTGGVKIKNLAFFGANSKLCCSGKLQLGRNFVVSSGLSIICDNEISIGDNFLSSWDTLIMDTDMHAMIDVETREHYSWCKPVKIGNNVWLGCRSVILKGAEIASGCVIGAQSVVSGKFLESNCIIAGSPATIIKRGVTRIPSENIY